MEKNHTNSTAQQQQQWVTDKQKPVIATQIKKMQQQTGVLYRTCFSYSYYLSRCLKTKKKSRPFSLLF